MNQGSKIHEFKFMNTVHVHIFHEHIFHLHFVHKVGSELVNAESSGSYTAPLFITVRSQNI